VLSRLLRRLSRRSAIAVLRVIRKLPARPGVSSSRMQRPDFGPLPPEPSDDAPGWLMERLGPGIKRHFPLPGPVERGPAVDVLAGKNPPPGGISPTGERALRPLFRASGNWHDGTAGRTP
jgi:hypothetical protein